MYALRLEISVPSSRADICLTNKPVRLLVVRGLVNLILFLVVLGVIAWWFRGYWPQMRRNYQRLRDTVRFIAKARAVVRDVRSGRVNPEDFVRGMNQHSAAQRSSTQRGGVQRPDPRAAKTVDVSPTAFKVVCPACGDSLSEAQTNALRVRGLRCPGSSRVQKDCPYYGHSLN